jgi:dienelactone hydrolase
MNPVSRRSALQTVGAVLIGTRGLCQAQQDVDTYPAETASYLKQIYEPEARRFAYRADYPGGFKNWQQQARTELRRRLAIDRIAASARHHRPTVEAGEKTDLGDYTRQLNTIETEPGVRIPFWLLMPKTKGPFPLGIFPHGHSSTGHHTTAGVFTSEAGKKRALAEDRDVAVQAVRLGFVAVAPAVRGLSAGIVPDLRGRHGKLDCRSHAMHSLLAGRTSSGERVWDMARILDWATKLPQVDARRILSMGNSGGGMVTIFTAACDERITAAVPSCSFAPTVSATGYAFHCDCNVVPGLVELGGLAHVAGLIAPRYLLSVNGRKDKLHSVDEVESAAAEVRRIYGAAGHADRYDHRWGTEGHRFYKDLMWPFVRKALTIPEGM